MTSQTLHSTPPARFASIALVTLLTIGGAISGLLSAVLVDLSYGWGGLLFPGLLFGMVLAAYLWFAGDMRSAGMVSAIMAESLAALLLAISSPVILGSTTDMIYILSLDAGFDRSPDALHVLTIAGLVGAAGVSIGFCALLQPRVPVWRIALEVGVCARRPARGLPEGGQPSPTNVQTSPSTR